MSRRSFRPATVRALAVAGAIALAVAVLGSPAPTGALSSLPEYVCYLEGGAICQRLPFGVDATAIVASDTIPAGEAGLEPPAEIVAYKWAPDGSSIAIIARGAESGLHREFSYDWQSKVMRAVAAATVERPEKYKDGSLVDPPADAPVMSEDGRPIATIRPDGDPPVPQVFFAPKDGQPARIGSDEIRGRACSRVCLSPGSRYVAYEVERPDGGSDVWVSVLGRTDSFVASEGGSRPAWHPYHRSGSTGGGGGVPCPGPFGLLGFGGAAAAVQHGRRRRR